MLKIELSEKMTLTASAVYESMKNVSLIKAVPSERVSAKTI
jgi:hypothetical protein